MDDLPKEMLDEIFSRLDKPSLFQASSVCKLWRCQALTHVITIDSSEQFVTAAENGDRISIVKSVYRRNWIEYGLYGACKGGHKDLVDLMITDDILSLNWGLHGACEGGHKELAELLLAWGAYDHNWGLYSACLGGHKELAELMITVGAEYFDLGLRGACEGGHKELIKLMIDKGSTNCDCGRPIEEHLK